MRPLSSLMLAAALAWTGCAAPRVYAPATALLHDDPADNPGRLALLSVTGSGFGLRGAGSGVLLRGAGGRVALEVGSDDRSRVPLWGNQRIVIAVPDQLADETELSIEVLTPFAASLPAHVERFRYRHYDVPRSDPASNPSPLAVAVDERSRVVVDEEFHTQLKRLAPDDGWTVFDLPQGRPEGIFASELFGDGPTPVSMLGESVAVDERSRVFATEGGWELYRGVHPNHSRIVMLAPEGGAPQIWPVPGNDNSIVGLAVDPATGRVWFTQGRRSVREGGVDHVAYEARLTSFDPAEIPSDPTFDFAPRQRCEVPAGERVGVCSETRHRRCLDDRDCVLAERVCAPGARDERACFREYPIPVPTGSEPLLLPGPLLRHTDGTIWYSGYWGGNYVGRFDPGTGAFQRFPLARPPGEASCQRSHCTCSFSERSAVHPCPSQCCLYRLIGQGPWGLAEDAGGGVAFSAQEAGSVSRIPKERFDDPRCAVLDARGMNPCVIEYPVLSFRPGKDQMHSLARDDDGNLWFGQGRVDGSDKAPDRRDDPARGATLGYVQAETGRVILLPPISLYPYVSTGVECRAAGEPVAHLAAGLAFDPRTRAIWFADFCRKRLGQIVPQRAEGPL